MMNNKDLGDRPTNQRLCITRIELGYALHTALRKICDSDATSLLYNVVDMADSGWIEFLDLAWVALQEATPDNVSECLRKAAEGLRWGQADRNAIRITIGFCDDDELKAMTSYIWKDDR